MYTAGDSLCPCHQWNGNLVTLYSVLHLSRSFPRVLFRKVISYAKSAFLGGSMKWFQLKRSG